MQSNPILESHTTVIVSLLQDHCTEQNVPIPEEPLVFSKFGDCIVGPNTPVPKDEQVEKLDYEVELGVVIGASVPRYTSKEDAHEYIGGFTVVHDVSARYVLCTFACLVDCRIEYIFFFFRSSSLFFFSSFPFSFHQRLATRKKWRPVALGKGHGRIRSDWSRHCHH